MNGGTGNDTLMGGTELDYLTGGEGQDLFYFAESGATNTDMIFDFSHQDDTIMLQDYLDGLADDVIQGLSFTYGVLDAGNYFEGPGQTGNGAENSGIFNDTTTGTIWYNPTSGEAGDAVEICAVGITAAPLMDHTYFVYYA